jgi:superfamily II DNA/RNA helicase
MENTDEVDIYEHFEDMGLKDTILRGIYSYGFEKPSEIQKRAIVKIIEGKDIIAQAQSGTGKTATFTIGMLESMDTESNTNQVLIMSHTRELSQQIFNVIKNISKYMKININLSVGGVSIGDNIESLRKKPQIIIGTPGRVLDMIHKRYINISTLKMLILDEADELLSHIFITQIYDIFQNLPPKIQVCLFSATMNESFFSITKKFMRDPVKILVKTEELTLEGIKQFYIDIEKNDFKYETLCDIYANISISQSIIYCNSIKIVDIISNKLNNDNFSVACIHGNMNQSERNTVLKEFRDGKSRVLISTDLLSRGIDIQQISIVINYDVPKNVDNYIHRIGRSGRYGRKGVAINFVTHNDIEQLRSIEKYYNTDIPELPNLDVLKI